MKETEAVNPRDDPEKPFLKLLKDLMEELENAIDSLSETPLEFQATYQFLLAKYMLAIADGFLLLREFSRGDVSKMAMRPAIEIMIRMQAVQREPSIFYRIAVTDTLEDKKWLRLASEVAGSDFDSTELDAGWERFKKAFHEKFPSVDLTEKSISLYDLARIAKLDRWYNSHYRLYSQATHGTLRAALGLSISDVEDHATMHLCVLATIQALQTIGGNAPNATSLHKRLHEFRDALDNK